MKTASMLIPHQLRVVEEKQELDTKRVKLDAFIHGETFPTLDPSEQARLRRQSIIMELYSQVLGERIDAF